MKGKDLRKWMAKLEEEGLLKRITCEVDWDLEIASITRRCQTEGGPALLFENIKDHKDTWCKKYFTSGLGTRERMALSLDLERDAPYKTMTKVIKDRLSKTISPIIVDSGPVKENIVKGKDVDLYQFPAPKHHHLDGGRYIVTFAGVVTKDPDTGYCNVGLYRGMVVDKNRIGMLLVPNQHWGVHFAQYRARGEAMPVAIVCGWDPCLQVSASTPLQHPNLKYGEYEFCGSLSQAPVELVKCETVDLMVPSSAEIVFEGFISPDPKSFMVEGPFGEYPGYYGGAASPKPTLEVTCVTFRNDPILRGLTEGITPGKWSEAAFFVGPDWSAGFWSILEAVGVPGILDVWAPPVTCGTILLIQIKKLYRGHAKQVANAVWGSTMSNYAAKFVIVVDEDIDIHDPEAVNWAISYRVNPAMDQVLFFPGTPGSILDPSTPLHLRNALKYGNGKWTRTLIDATKNWELEPQEQYGGQIFPPIATDLTPEQVELINRRWKEYGF